MWRKVYFLGVIILLVLGILSLIVPPSFFPQDSDFSKAYLVFSVNYNQDIITHSYTKEKVVALTFDDGPDPRFTPSILDTLNKYHVKATFFVVGEDALLYPDLVQRAVAEGHEIENHTFTHPDLIKDTDLTINEEMLWCQEAIEHIVVRKPQYFRPPRKLFNANILKISDIYGYRTILWTVCLENHKAKTPEAMVRRVVRKCQPGSIVLAHDGHLDRSNTVKAMPLLIEALQKKGYRFVTVDELVTNYNSSKAKKDLSYFLTSPATPAT
ncbi:MAG: polysaccharide deacetylase family protein [Chitinophagales bacterium]